MRIIAWLMTLDLRIHNWRLRLEHMVLTRMHVVATRYPQTHPILRPLFVLYMRRRHWK